jgi:lipoprotein-anchoring transpeptidase ErfK/SrfK
LGVLGTLLVALVAAAPATAQTPTIEAGVTIAGVDVGGLTEAQARAKVQDAFDRRLTLTIGAGTLRVPPANFGARARVARAVDAAQAAPPGAALKLPVQIADWKLRAWIKRRAKIFDRAAVSARARLVGGVPRLTKARRGRVINRAHARVRLAGALRNHRRDGVVVPVKTIRPALTATRFGPAIAIRRGSKRLTLYRSAGAGPMRAVRVFGVATGMPAYPTPLGSFTIVRMARHPWWYPPSSDWARGAKPIPPGPGNPLGTRWMGLSAGGVGIHGTPNAASIGYSASHGCIRMRISEAEWLFARVRLGTPVFIVGS